MNPEDVPDEAVDDAVDAWHDAPRNEHGVIALDDHMRYILAAVLPDPEPETDADSCRLVDVDGETVRVRGSGDMDEQDQQALGEVFRAARARMKAEKDAEEAAIRADERAKVAEEARTAAAAIKADGSRIGGAALAGFATQLEEGLAARGEA